MGIISSDSSPYTQSSTLTQLAVPNHYSKLEGSEPASVPWQLTAKKVALLAAGIILALFTISGIAALVFSWPVSLSVIAVITLSVAGLGSISSFAMAQRKQLLIK